jgi:hypothetical protein
MNILVSNKSCAAIAGDITGSAAAAGFGSNWRERAVLTADAPRASRRDVATHALRVSALALGITVSLSTAHASPLIPNLPFGYDYYTSVDEPAAAGALNGSVPNSDPGQGGLCPEIGSGTPVTGCGVSGAPGPALIGGLIPIIPYQLTGGDSNYQLSFEVTDNGPHNHTYEVTLDGTFLGIANLADGYTVYDTLSDGLSPGEYYLGITDQFFANNNPSGYNYKDDYVSISVTEADVPEPGSLAVVATGLGLLGLLRRYRAGV